MKRLLVPGLVVLLTAGGCSEPPSHPESVVLSAENADQVVAGHSPDGESLYWWERTDNGWQLWRSRSDLTEADSLPFHSRSEANPLVWSPDGTRFVVPANPNTPFAVLWLMNGDGSAARRVIEESSIQYPVAWHPDGRRLSYYTFLDESIWTLVVDVDAGTSTRLLPTDTIPHVAQWSPDGRHMLLNMFEQGRTTLFMADSLGNGRRALLGDGMEGAEGLFAWAPDGSAAVFRSSRSGTSDLWLAAVDGSPPRQLTNDVRDDYIARWSPDSKWIAFQSTRGQQNDIWVVPAAGGEARRVTDDVSTDRLSGWRPNSSEIVFMTGRALQAVWYHALADGTERQLTHDTLDVTFFNLNSQGGAMLVINRGGGVSDFAVMPDTGGEPRVVLRDARATHARWSPSGSHLAFASTRGGTLDIWVMRADGTDLRQLTSSPAQDDRPLFGATDSTILYWSTREARLSDMWSVPLAGGESTRITRAETVNTSCWQAWRNDHLILGVMAPPPMTFTTARVREDGSLQHLWTAGPAYCASVSPIADSAFVLAIEPDGGTQSHIVPLSGGTGRPILARNQAPDTWSPDGRQIAFAYSSNPPYDLGILTLDGGAVRRITSTAASEYGTEWTADGRALVFNRLTPVSRIATTDLTRLLEEKN